MSLVFNMAGGASPKPVSLSIKTPPTKTAYTEGEKFSTSGMVVQVTYSNGVTATVTGYSYSPTGALSMNNTAITISYTEGGVTVTATQSITVKKAYNATFANNTWAEIVEACHTNSVPSSWVVGNYKDMTINGRSCRVDIIGKNHDTYSSGGKAPLTFQLHSGSGLGSKQMNSTITKVGGWGGTQMRNTHLPSILATMPSEVQSGIREVNKVTSNGGTATTVITTADKLFLLSVIEITGTVELSVSGEGTQYAYYSAGNSTKKYYEGYDGDEEELISWWTRSSQKGGGSNFGYVWTSGSVGMGAPPNWFYIPFAFCF